MTFRLNLADAVADLAPPPPPCFLNRVAWMEYLKSAAAAQNSKHEQKVILVTPDGTARFNYKFNICEDCTQIKSVEMDKAGSCDPEFLSKQPGAKP